MMTALRGDGGWAAAWCAVALAFPWSNSFMSVATGGLALVALLSLWRRNPGATADVWDKRSGWALIALVLWGGVSALWSSEPNLALHDVRVKLPLLVGGLVLLSRGPVLLSDRGRRAVLSCAAFSAVLASVTVVVLDLADGGGWGGRSASRFISHIRFGLWWAILLPWLTRGLARPWGWACAFSAVLVWTWTESVTGLLVGVLTAGWWLPALLRRSPQDQADWPSGSGALRRLQWPLAALSLLFLFLFSALPMATPEVETLAEKSPYGEAYVHRPDRHVMENGHFIWTHLAWGEMAAAWHRRSALRFPEVAPRLIRFLSSKGLKKDRDGVMALSDLDIVAIEGGCVSVVDLERGGWFRRWNRFVFNWGQWLDGQETANASILARAVYQGVAWSAVGDVEGGARLLGVGTGGTRDALTQAFERHRPDWPSDQRRRPHNQWLTLWLALGPLGCLLLVVSMVAAFRRPWGLVGVCILTLSAVFEDTLETQAGVTLALWVLALPAFISWPRGPVRRRA